MTPLHHLGDALRNAFLAIPLRFAELLFLLLPILLLWWVLRLPDHQAQPEGRPPGRGENLKTWAALALLFQVLIYWFL